MAKAKQPKYLHDGVYQKKHYVRAWKEKREIVVQVWLNKKMPDGEPDGDWAMPVVLGFETAIAQAVRQTE